jgi:hypothetical protein
VTTAKTTDFGIWFTTKSRWIITLSGIALNVFANVFAFAILFNTNSEDQFVCDGLFDWDGIASPSDSFLLFIGLMLIWIGMLGILALVWFATAAFTKGLGGLSIVCGYTMVMGDLFLFMGYVAKDSCVQNGPSPFKEMAPYLPFVFIVVHAWWSISYTPLKDIIMEFRDTRSLIKADITKSKKEKEAVKQAADERNSKMKDLETTGARLAFKPFSVLGKVMRASAEKHEHPL